MLVLDVTIFRWVKGSERLFLTWNLGSLVGRPGPHSEPSESQLCELPIIVSLQLSEPSTASISLLKVLIDFLFFSSPSSASLKLLCHNFFNFRVSLLIFKRQKFSFLKMREKHDNLLLKGRRLWLLLFTNFKKKKDGKSRKIKNSLHIRLLKILKFFINYAQFLTNCKNIRNWSKQEEKHSRHFCCVIEESSNQLTIFIET